MAVEGKGARQATYFQEALESRVHLSSVQEVEPNDSLLEAQPLTGDTSYTVSGRIDASALYPSYPYLDQDFYSVSVNAGDTIQVNVRASGSATPQVDPYVELYSPTGAYVTGDYDSGSGSTGAAGFGYTATESGIWRVMVAGQGYDVGGYVLDMGGGVNANLKIDSVSVDTFVTTDSIEVHASGVAPGATVFWTVKGGGAAADITGFAESVPSTANGSGVATFTFTPSENSNLVNDRRSTWTKGSRQANPPISFDVVAEVVVGDSRQQSSLSGSLGVITQDETDILRQEYYDYNIPVPARSEVVPSLGEGFNQGNYGVQLSVGLRERYEDILAAYHGQSVSVTIGGKAYATNIPLSAGLTISSGYRNPQRNKAVGSVHPDSKHTRGRALDLVPESTKVTINVGGHLKKVHLSLHDALYPALFAAASTEGAALAEKGSLPVELGSPQENHIHVQW